MMGRSTESETPSDLQSVVFLQSLGSQDISSFRGRFKCHILYWKISNSELEDNN